MKLDFYQTTILTVVALLLVIFAVRLPIAGVRAQNAEPRLQFDPDIRQIDVPGSMTSMFGRVAIDTQTGNIYGFPTNGRPYPYNLHGNEPGISKPIFLGRFDISSLPQR